MSSRQSNNRFYTFATRLPFSSLLCLCIGKYRLEMKCAYRDYCDLLKYEADLRFIPGSKQYDCLVLKITNLVFMEFRLFLGFTHRCLLAYRSCGTGFQNLNTSLQFASDCLQGLYSNCLRDYYAIQSHHKSRGQSYVQCSHSDAKVFCKAPSTWMFMLAHFLRQIVLHGNSKLQFRFLLWCQRRANRLRRMLSLCYASLSLNKFSEMHSSIAHVLVWLTR